MLTQAEHLEEEEVLPTSGLSPASAKAITVYDDPAPGHSQEGAAAVGQDDQAGPLLLHPPAKRARGQRSLAEFARERTDEVSPYEELVKARTGTRNFPAFTVGLGGTHLDDFLEEYHKARQVDGVLVITVVAQKTAAQGPAPLTIEDPKEQLLLNRYVTHIRPQIGGGGGGGGVSVKAPDSGGKEQEGGQAGPPVRQDYKEV